ncbi:methyltransferase domain-containing protein [Micromonospora sp. NPDC050397]|uniref:methyltransferase domain-containing protein n=1 Tax=Micromonospora sp. NPDC050397 TaxID=3364279 RepID=UPI00384D3E80
MSAPGLSPAPGTPSTPGAPPTPDTSPAALATCLLCGRRGGHRSVLGGVLWRCGSCAFSWTAADSPPPVELYDESYFQGEGYEDYFLSGPRRFESGRRLRWLLSVARPSSLVEAGSAGGFFVEAARGVGIAAEGVEVSESAARFARERLGVPVRVGCFEVVAPVRSVEAVCAFHVLEHVEEPREFLRAARDALVPGGWLALEVPNIASAAAGRLGHAWPGLQPRYHRWHFSPESLTRLVRECGFRIVRQDTAVFRYYMPARYRWRHLHHLLPADLVGIRSPRLTHPRLGDLLRVVAQLPTSTRRRTS